MLARLPKTEDSNLLAGFNTSDDAGVYQISEDTALVTTADFITPPVDDPFIYGQISAANSISDIYAMGARPITAINLLALPEGKLGPEITHGIVEGALSKITEAGAVLAGGHTISDQEPKFGLAVTGLVHPRKFWRNIGAKPGDVLILTKPIGSGVIFNANLKKYVSETALQACIKVLTTLNKTACEMLQKFEIHAATDVTGFGLAGHTFEMAHGSNVTARLYFEKIPLLPEVIEMYEKGVNTGANMLNRQLVEKALVWKRERPFIEEQVFFDPMTSGGLLVAVPANEAEIILRALHNGGVGDATIIGEITEQVDGVSLIIV